MRMLLGLLLLLAFTSYSSAKYCLCKDGVGDKVLQANIDYACGALADCTDIQPNGDCNIPDTVKAHCDYAVNSYYQNAGQADESCSFRDSATLSDVPPSNAVAGCVYPSSPSKGKSPSTPTTPPTPPTPQIGSPGTPTLTPPTSGGTAGGSVVCPRRHGNGAASLYISYALSTLAFSALLFLWSR